MFLGGEVLPSEVNSNRNRPTGLLTSTVGTFIQQGTTTEFATKVFGTHLDGHYAKIVSTSSRVFFAIPSAAAGEALGGLRPTGLISSVTATRVSGLATTLHTTDYYRTYIDGTYAQLVSSYSRVVHPSVHTVVATKGYDGIVSGNIYPTAVHDRKQPVIEVSPVKIADKIAASKASVLLKESANFEKLNTRVTSSTSQHSDDDSENLLKARMIEGFKPSKPKIHLPTYTVGHGSDHADDTTEVVFSVNKNVEAVVAGKHRKDLKVLRPRNNKFKTFNIIHSKEDLLHVESSLPTVTYVGFDDFVTTVHNTVIVFMPHSKAAIPTPKSVGHNLKVTTLSDFTIPTVSSKLLEQSRNSLFNKPRPPISNNQISATKTYSTITHASPTAVPTIGLNRGEKKLNVENKPMSDYVENRSKILKMEHIDASHSPELEISSELMSSFEIEPSITSIDATSDVMSELSSTHIPTESIVLNTVMSDKKIIESVEMTVTTEESPKITTEMAPVETTTEGAGTTPQELPTTISDSSSENELGNDVETGRRVNTNPEEQIIVGEEKPTKETSTIQYVTKVIPNTVYKTFTYFTTFFIPDGDKKSTSVRSSEVTSTEVKFTTSLVDIREILATAIAQQILPSESIPVLPSVLLESTTEAASTTTNEAVENTVPLTTQNDIITTNPTTPLPELDEEEIELLLKTQYTTYTYLTTYFQGKKSSISSREEVVTNIITSTLDKDTVITDPAVAGLFARDDSIISSENIAPTSVGIGRPTEDIYAALHESDIRPTARLVPENLESIVIRDDANDEIKTYYTTYTYFTTLFADGSTTINSRTEVYSNVVTPTNVVEKVVQTSTLDLPTVVEEEVKATKQVAIEDAKYLKKYQTTMRAKEESVTKDPETASEAPLEDPIKIDTTVQIQADQFIPEKIPLDIELIPDVSTEKPRTTESSKSEVSEVSTESTTAKVEFRLPSENIDNEVASDISGPSGLDDQLSQESNTDVNPSHSLLLQTSYTTFTYFTTLYKGQTTDIVSRLETLTNVVTETVNPSLSTSVEEAKSTETIEVVPTQTAENYPVTYFTTFTYWTTAYKDGSTVVTSREETISNVVTPTSGSEEQTQTSIVSTEAAPKILPTLTQVDLEPTTFFTTYTYYTTSYIGESTVINSRLETETNVVAPTQVDNDLAPTQTGRAIGTVAPAEQLIEKTSITPSEVLQPTGLISTIRTSETNDGQTTLINTDVYGTYIDGLYAQVLESSTQVLTPDVVSATPVLETQTSSTGVVSLNVGSIVDVDGITTTYFTTKAIGTYIGDLYAQVVESTTSLNVDTDRTPEPPQASRTGIVRLIEGSIVKDGTTTAYESRVIGTIVDGFYAQIIESTSSTITPTATIQTVEATTDAAHALDSSIADDHTEKGEEEEDADSKNGKGKLGFPGRKNTFTPVIRPFAPIGTRNRPTFQPKKRPTSATTITRTTLTPTVTATPASVSNSESSANRNRFNLRRQSSIGANQVTNDIKPSSTRKFSRGRSSTPGGFSSSSSAAYNPSSRRSSSTRIQPTSASSYPFGSSSRRGGGFSAGRNSFSASARSSSGGGASSTSFQSSARFRIRPTSSLPFFSRSSTITTPNPEIHDNTLSDIDNNFTDGGERRTDTAETTKNEPTTVTEATSFRRPQSSFKLRRPILPIRTPSPSTETPKTTPSLRKFNQRKPDNSIKDEKTTSKPKLSRPTSRPLIFKQRPTSSLFPPRGLFKRPEDEAENNENESLNQQETKVEETEITDSETEASEVVSKVNPSTTPANKIAIRPFAPRILRRSRRESKGSETNEDKHANGTSAKVVITPFDTSLLRRLKRQTDYGSFSSRRRSSNTPITPPKKPASQDFEYVYEYVDYDEPATPAPTKPSYSRTRGRSNNYQPTQKPETKVASPPKAPSPPPRIRPSTASSRGTPFTLTNQRATERSSPVTLAPKTNLRSTFRRSSTSPTRGRTTDSRNTDTSRLRAPKPRVIDSTPTRSSGRRYNSVSSAPRRPPSRSRFRNEIDNSDNQYLASAFDGTITVTHKVPTEVTIPVINGKNTEYKQVIRNTMSTQVLGPKQYSTTQYEGKTVFILNNEVTSTPAPGVTEVTQFILRESPTTSVTFTPTTIRGRKTSFSHIIPSTAYEVEPVVNTINDALPSAPLANLLLSQLLLGNFGLQQNVNPLLAFNQAQQQVPTTPTTEFKTRSTTYVTTITDLKSTVLPITLRGKAIMTTIINSKEDVITATEYITDTIVVTPTQAPNNNQINSLLLPALLQAQLQQQQPAQPNPLLLQQAQLLQQQQKLLQAEKIAEKEQKEIEEISDEDENRSSEFDLISKEEISQVKHIIKPTFRPKLLAEKEKIVPQKHTSVVTIYVSGKNPGEFSSVLSTVITDGASLVKREAITPPIKEIRASDNMPIFYDSKEQDFDLYVMSAINDIEGSEQSSGNYETRSLESILGDVTEHYKSSNKNDNFSTVDLYN